jgi:CrcB protein
MREFLLVAVGGALGSMGRYSVTLLTATASGKFPLGTFLVNILGSFAIGIAYALSRGGAPSLNSQAALFWMTGVLGGFTTFSAFSLQTINLIQQQDWLNASLNIIASVLCCLAATALGIYLATSKG